MDDDKQVSSTDEAANTDNKAAPTEDKAACTVDETKYHDVDALFANDKSVYIVDGATCVDIEALIADTKAACSENKPVHTIDEDLCLDIKALSADDKAACSEKKPVYTFDEDTYIDIEELIANDKAASSDNKAKFTYGEAVEVGAAHNKPTYTNNEAGYIDVEAAYIDEEAGKAAYFSHVTYVNEKAEHTKNKAAYYKSVYTKTANTYDEEEKAAYSYNKESPPYDVATYTKYVSMLKKKGRASVHNHENVGDELWLLLKWEPNKEEQWVPANIANVHLPEAVIKYYQCSLELDGQNAEDEEYKQAISKWTLSDGETTEEYQMPEYIVRATEEYPQLMFWVKWAGTDQVELIPALAANKLFPQKVIQFYQGVPLTDED